jgi:hypothetical protein
MNSEYARRIHDEKIRKMLKNIDDDGLEEISNNHGT